MQFSKAGIVGLIIGLLGGLAGMTAAIISDPLEGGIFSVVFIIIMTWVFVKFFRPLFTASKLQKTGVSASAVILDASDTGVTINENPQVKLKLEVQHPYRGAYQAEAKILISRLQTSLFQPGKVIPIKIDPKDPHNIALDSSGQSNEKFNETRKAEMEKMLRETEKLNREIEQIGKSSRAIVLKYEELGVNVNGNNPAVKLLLEVLPEDRARFKAETSGIVKESSVPKFQPGEEIEVKYDPKNISRVTIISSD